MVFFRFSASHCCITIKVRSSWALQICLLKTAQCKQHILCLCFVCIKERRSIPFLNRVFLFWILALFCFAFLLAKFNRKIFIRKLISIYSLFSLHSNSCSSCGVIHDVSIHVNYHSKQSCLFQCKTNRFNVHSRAVGK